MKQSYVNLEIILKHLHSLNHVTHQGTFLWSFLVRYVIIL